MPHEEKVHFFDRPIIPATLWFGAAVIIPVIQYLRGSYNNYKIFRSFFYHLINKQPLYIEYPSEYFDTIHYGPFFGVLIAPFALLPDIAGMILWSLFNTWMLYISIRLLPISLKQKTWILWIAFIELTTAQHSLQINPFIASLVILTFVFVHRQKLLWAPLFALAGFIIKIYGIVAFSLGVFSNQKARLALFSFLWAFILFALPMLLSSPEYIIESYGDWAHSLSYKNTKNAGMPEGGNMQNISVIGMITRITSNPQFPLMAVLIPAAILMLVPLVRLSQYKFLHFQLHYLSALLISIVMFSTSSESPTYIIAVTGASIYFVIQQRPLSRWNMFLFGFMFLFTCLSPTDIFPRFIRKEFIQPYALKALPCFLIWLTIIYKMMLKATFDLPETQQRLSGKQFTPGVA
jgi:hypothetical protein